MVISAQRRSLDFISEQQPKKKQKKQRKGEYRNTSTEEDMFSFLNSNVSQETTDKRTKGTEEIPGDGTLAKSSRGGGASAAKKKKTDSEMRLELVQKQRHHRELEVLQRDLKQRLARNADAPGMHRAIQNKADDVAREIAASTASQRSIEQQLKTGKDKKKLAVF